MASASPPCAGDRGHLRQRGGRGGSAMNESNIQRVAVVGTGVIGACWATFFLARGLDVTATDPAPGAEAALRDTIRAQWPAMERLGVAPGASPDRLRFAASPEAAVAQAQFVQENGPERVELNEAGPVPAPGRRGAGANHFGDEFLDHHRERVPGRLRPPSRARRAGPSVQSAASDPAG